jgi:hypothetical protein
MPLDYLYLQIIYVRCKQIIEFHYITSLNSHTHSKKQLVEYIFDRTLFIAYKRDFGVFDNNNIVPILKRYKHIFGLVVVVTLLLVLIVPFQNGMPSNANAQAVGGGEDTETVRLGRSSFFPAGMRPIVDVTPFHITAGHVSMTLPANSGNIIKIVVGQLTGSAPFHAVALSPIKVLDVRTGETYYHLDLRPTMSGTNPFTGRSDTVSNYADVLLWNSGRSVITLADDNAITATIVFSR